MGIWIIRNEWRDVEDILKDGSIGWVGHMPQSWKISSDIPAYNIMIIYIWRVCLHHFVADWWNVAAVSTFIKEHRVCNFDKFIPNCAFEKMQQNWAPLQCGDRVYQKCVRSTGKRQTKILQQSQPLSFSIQIALKSAQWGHGSIMLLIECKSVGTKWL